MNVPSRNATGKNNGWPGQQAPPTQEGLRLIFGHDHDGKLRLRLDAGELSEAELKKCEEELRKEYGQIYTYDKRTMFLNGRSFTVRLQASASAGQNAREPTVILEEWPLRRSPAAEASAPPPGASWLKPMLAMIRSEVKKVYDQAESVEKHGLSHALEELERLKTEMSEEELARFFFVGFMEHAKVVCKEHDKDRAVLYRLAIRRFKEGPRPSLNGTSLRQKLLRLFRW
jgi:hypothetical protein